MSRFAEMILARAPATAILATSRQPLGIPGEQVIPVPPLGLPEDAADPETAAKAEAVELFLRRARARAPGFAPDASGIHTILEICRRLDGLPLAIELAASHARSLSMEVILRRIVEGRSLPQPSAAAPERHRSLANLVDWSYRLLTSSEQALLRRLSIFRGGCTLAAAEAVCGGWGRIERWQVCDLVARLVERSLVEPDFAGSENQSLPRGAGSAGAAGGGGLPAARYRLLDTIRVFSAQRLAEDASEAASVESRYLDHFAALAAPRPEEKGPTRTAWVQRVEPEYANLVHAMDLALDRGRTDIAFGLGEMTAYFWVQTGQWIEGNRRLDLLLQSRNRAQDPNQDPTRARERSPESRASEVRVLSQAGLIATLLRQTDARAIAHRRGIRPGTESRVDGAARPGARVRRHSQHPRRRSRRRAGQPRAEPELF